MPFCTDRSWRQRGRIERLMHRHGVRPCDHGTAAPCAHHRQTSRPANRTEPDRPRLHGSRPEPGLARRYHLHPAAQRWLSLAAIRICSAERSSAGPHMQVELASAALTRSSTSSGRRLIDPPLRSRGMHMSHAYRNARTKADERANMNRRNSRRARSYSCQLATAQLCKPTM